MKNTLRSKNLPFVAPGIPTPFCNPKTKTTSNLKGFLTLVVMVLGMGVSWGQTNPAAFDLSGGSFTFSSQTATGTTYPTNMQGWTTGTNNIATLPTAAPAANQSLVASGTASTSGLSNLGANGFNFLSTSSSPNQQVGEICVSLNSTGRTSLLVSWTAADQSATSSLRLMNLTLQYRVGISGVFTTVASTTYTTSSSSQATAQTFSNIALPAACDNQSVVQIRWVYYESASQSGTRDAIRLDDITVSSSAGASCTPPTSQASSLTANTTTTTTSNYAFTRGNGDNVLVVARLNATVAAAPASGTTYTPSTTGSFTGTTTTGTGNIVVYNGAAAGASTTTGDLSLTNLTAGSYYKLTAYEYATTGTCYNTTSPASGSFYTLSTAPTGNPAAFTASATSTTAVGLSFSAASTLSASGYLIIQKAGGTAATFTPANGTAYSTGSSISDGTIAAVVASTSSNSQAISSLTANTQYTYTIVPYKYDGTNAATYNYYTTSNNTATVTTLATAPSLTAASATVDAAFDVTFTDANSWANNITGITVGGTALTAGYVVGTNKITFTPSASVPAVLLQTAGTSKSIVVSATGFSTSTVAQTIGVGAATKLAISVQPTAPTTNGGALAQQPTVLIQDQYGNTTASTAIVTSTAVQSTWTAGGSNTKAGVAGSAAFSGLTATSAAAVTGATIAFTSGSLTSVTSSAFNLPAIVVPASGSAAITTCSATITDPGGSGNYANAIVGGSLVITPGTAGTKTRLTFNSFATESGYDYLYVYNGNSTSAAQVTGSPFSGTSLPSAIISSATDGTLTLKFTSDSGTNDTGFDATISCYTPLDAPVATAATSVGATSFTANWNAVTGASSGYLLDVSTSATFGTLGAASVTEGFESGMPGSYTTGNTTLGTGVWALTTAMSGTTGVNAGSKSAQLQSATGSALISPSFSNISTVNFYVTSGAASGSLQVNYSTDGGSTWTAATGSPFTALGTTKTLKTATINSSSSDVKLQFYRTAQTIYIDDITINYLTTIPSYVSGYNAKPISGQATVSSSVTGLTSGATYYYRVRATDGTASVNSNVITVTTKSTPTVTPTVGNYTYTGAAQGPSAATNTGTGTTYTFSYEGVSPTTYAASATAPTNAGSYTVTATVAADGDYVAASSVATAFTIAKAPLTITANNQTKCAGITLSFVGTEFTSGTLLGSDAVTSVSLTSTGAGSAATGGTYSIVPSAATGTGLSNYTITYTNGSLTVNQSTITLGYIDDILPTDTSFNIPYTATTGSPNKYSLATAASGGSSIAMPNFTPISNANLVSSPITVIIPASAAAEYGFNLTVTNTTTGCSQVFPFQFHVTNVVAGTIAGDQSICSGATPSAITSSQAGSSSDGDPITYTWEQSTTSLSSGYSAISGATSEGYVPGALTQTTYYKRVTHYAGTNPDVTSDTDPVTITVNPTLTASVSIASNDTDNVICFGTNVTFTATPTNGGASPSYQWKVNGSNVGTDSATYTTSALANNDVVSVVLTSNATPCLAGSTATSNSITIVLQNKWLVTASSLWSDSSNWTCGVPSSTDNILIDTGSPQLDTNFTIAGSLTISGSGTLTINPTSVITISGTADFGGRPVTIKSDATGTGTIGQVTGTLTGATNVTVERYIPNKRSWRALTAPVSTATSINANWQEGGTSNGINGFDIWSPTPGSGITTGGSSNSLLQYDSGSDSWIGIAATDGASSMMNGDKNKPFMAFVTGPYGSGNITNNLAAATTIRATGTILTGTKTYASASGLYSFIGNPYASPLNLTTMLASNTSFGGNIWVWDANVAGDYSVGTYNLFDNGTYSNISSNPNISGAQIQSGQAFFVKQSSGNSVDFSIQEAHKGATFNNAVFRDAAPAQLLRVGIYKQTNNEWSGRDGAMAVFLSDAEANQTTNKISNGSENVAFTKNSELFASEHHLPLVASDVLNVRVWNTTASANYKLKINTEQFTTTNLDATLEDLFTNSRTPIALDGTAIEYPFAVTTDAASTGNRFRIVFQNAALGMNNPKANGITILPNPITGDTFQVNLGTLEMGMYTYSICNALGQEVETGSINNVTQNTNYNVKFKSNTAAGLYIMKVIGTVNAVFTAKLIKK
jgi:hypothetical protein